MTAALEQVRENGGFTRRKKRFAAPFGTNEKERFWNTVFDGAPDWYPENLREPQ